MSDDFTRRLEEAAARHGRAAMADAELTVVAASVIGKARRRRRVTGALSVTGAFLGVTMMGGGVVALANGWGSTTTDPANPFGAPAVAMSQSPEPTADPSTQSSATPTPSTGLEEYPPLQQARDKGFPTSYEMRDWVWDYVGEGWSVQSYSPEQDPFDAGDSDGTSAVLYLANPDGDLFELAVLPPEYSSGTAVVSWEEDYRLARIAWTGNEATGYSAGGAEVDLTTGDVYPLVFTTPWGISSTVAPVAVSAAGNELWKAWLGDHVRYYRYGPSEGWTVASVNDMEGIGDLGASPRWDAAVGAAGSEFSRAMVVRGDGAAVLFEKRLARGQEGFEAPLEVAIYDLDDDSSSQTQASLTVPPAKSGLCTVVAWVGAGALNYRCGEGASLQTVKVPGVAPVGSLPDAAGAAPMDGQAVIRSGYVGFREPTPRFAIDPYCGC